ncbi:DUF3618 domain-containing protein [Amycolatopsis benzoatilytica]|uniref:DUF3618 domain-containing protein n=1 Tax=Amycolatopsis benzoatilytica TaxID=346045 RepID=UPI0003608784|nr:DUF3618 domain-containing protein [Amycolatopsis benzoatilytica]
MTEQKPLPSEADVARADRDVTREELAETLDALGHKLDVRSRAAERVDATIDQATAKVAQTVPPPAAETFRAGALAVRNKPVPVFAAVFATVVLVRLLARRRRGRRER